MFIFKFKFLDINSNKLYHFLHFRITNKLDKATNNLASSKSNISSSNKRQAASNIRTGSKPSHPEEIVKPKPVITPHDRLKQQVKSTSSTDVLDDISHK